MKIALYGKRIDESNRLEVEELLIQLLKRKAELLFHKRFIKEIEENQLSKYLNGNSFSKAIDIKSQGVDFLISIGGDGTFLDTILLIQEQNIPILGINTGRLGFLSNTSPAEIELAVEALYNKNYSIEERSMLEFNSQSNLFGEDNQALNDISILRRDSSSMITIEVKLDGKHLNTYWADGLIISTATGSTAYSLSCGGPILMPGGGNIVITPIAPHNLNVRPIVIDEDSILEITVNGRSDKNLVVLDSRIGELKNGESIKIKKADYKLQLVQLEEHSFINSLKNKLNWGLDKRNN